MSRHQTIFNAKTLRCQGAKDLRGFNGREKAQNGAKKTGALKSRTAQAGIKRGMVNGEQRRRVGARRDAGADRVEDGSSLQVFEVSLRTSAATRSGYRG